MSIPSTPKPTKDEIQEFCGRCDNFQSEGTCKLSKREAFHRSVKGGITAILLESAFDDSNTKIDDMLDGQPRSLLIEKLMGNALDLLENNFQESCVADGECNRAHVDSQRGIMTQDGFHPDDK